ncbi:MAG: type IV pilus modification PilV family protein [Planctomycetota bacterium]
MPEGAVAGARPRGGPAGGFTLVEVVAAGFVLAVTAVGLAVTLAQGKRLAETPRDEMAARTVIQGVYSELTATPWVEVGTTFQDAGFQVPGLKAPNGDPDGMPGEIVFEYGPGGDTSMYLVTLRVRWKVGTEVRTLESVRYLSNVRGDTGTPAALVTSRYPGCEGAHLANPGGY